MTEASDIDFGFEVSLGLVLKLAMAAIGFVGTIVFARVLGPTSFGAFYLLLALVNIADRPVSGIAAGAKKRFSETGSNRSEIVGAQLLAIAVCTAIVVIGVAALRGRLVSYTGVATAPLLFVVLFTSFALFTSFSTLVTATGRVSIESLVDFLGSVLTLPFQLALVLASFGVAGMVYGLSGATAIAALLAGYALSVRPSFPSRETYRSIWEFARFSILSSVVNKSYNRFDVLLLGAVLTSTAVGYYEVAFRMTMPAVYLGSIFGSGLMARVSNFHSKGEINEIRSDIKNTSSFISIISIPIFFGALAIAEPLVVTLYGSEYAPAAPLLIGIALYQLIRTQTIPYHHTLDGIDQPDKTLTVGILTLGFNILVGLLLVFEYGTIGVVAATVLAESLRYTLSVLYLRQEIRDFRLLPRGFLEQVTAGIVMCSSVSILRSQLAIESWVDLVILLSTGAVCYFGLLTIISPQFQTTVRQVTQTIHQEFNKAISNGDCGG